MTPTERAVHAGPAARALTVMVEDRSQNRRSLQNMNKSQLARPRTGQVKVRYTRGEYCTALRQKMPVFASPETNA